MDSDAILSQCKIQNPCPMDWDRVSGDDRVRYCAGCGKHVYNLAATGPDETASLISTLRERGEKKRVRLYQRRDGTLFTSRCQPAARSLARPWQFTIRSLMAVIAACAAVLGLTRWLSPDQKQTKPPPPANAQILMGDLY